MRLPTTPFLRCLVAPAGRTFVHIILVNLNLDQRSVCSWVIVCCIKVINASTFRPIEFMYHVMLSLMKCHFLSLTHHPHLLHQHPHLHLYLMTNLMMLHILLCYCLTMVQVLGVVPVWSSWTHRLPLMMLLTSIIAIMHHRQCSPG